MSETFNLEKDEGKKTLLILEDDPSVQTLYRNELSRRFNLHFASNLGDLTESLARVKNGELVVDLLVADLELPDGSFLDLFLTEDALRGFTSPILMVSAFDDLSFIRRAFGGGVVDYVVKPFSMNSLIVKIDMLFETIDREQKKQSFLTLDASSHSVKNSSGSVALTTKEYQLVTFMLNDPERGATKEELIKCAWKGVRVSEKNLEVQFSRLRKKLAPLKVSIVYRAPDRYHLTRVEEKEKAPITSGS